jgi:LysM repeat protein
VAASATRQWLARIGAPAAFLLAVTIAVLLIRAGVRGNSTPGRATSTRPATHSSTTPTAQSAKTVTGTRTDPSARYYVVRKGDTFTSISGKAGTTVSRLEALNPGVSSNALRVGQRIRVK